VVRGAPAGHRAYLTAPVNNNNQKAGGNEGPQFGGGSLMGLALPTVANVNSRIANPEQSDFFMIFLPLSLIRAGQGLILAIDLKFVSLSAR